jgi:preprotein translocase subunit SecG
MSTKSLDSGVGQVLVISAFFVAIVFSIVVLGLSIWGLIVHNNTNIWFTYFKCTLFQLIAAVLFIVAIAVIGGLLVWKSTDTLSKIRDESRKLDFRNKKALAECKRNLGGLLFNIDDDALESALGVDTAGLQAIRGRYRADA